MKKLICTNLPCPEEGYPVNGEEDIKAIILNVFHRQPLVLKTCLGENIVLVYRSSRSAMEGVPTNPFTNEPYHWYTVNLTTGALDGTFNFGTGRIIGLLPDV